MLPEYIPLVKQLSIHIVLHILTENFELSYWSICEFSEIQYQSSQHYMWLQNVGIDFCFWGLHVSLLDHHDWWFCSEKILCTFFKSWLKYFYQCYYNFTDIYLPLIWNISGSTYKSGLTLEFKLLTRFEEILKWHFWMQ